MITRQVYITSQDMWLTALQHIEDGNTAKMLALCPVCPVEKNDLRVSQEPTENM
jgi:hypothetical protein